MGAASRCHSIAVHAQSSHGVIGRLTVKVRALEKLLDSYAVERKPVAGLLLQTTGRLF